MTADNGEISGVSQEMSSENSFTQRPTKDEALTNDAAPTAGRVKVPAGQTPLNDDLGHRLIDVFNEGGKARDEGKSSPYHGHSLEHCLHAMGWVQRDLRLALDAHRFAALASRAAPQAEPVDEASHPDWIWYCESTSGVPFISLGRWPKDPKQKRYKLAEIQPTEHDHPAPKPSVQEADEIARLTKELGDAAAHPH